jgi:hypothetical protein
MTDLAHYVHILSDPASQALQLLRELMDALSVRSSLSSSSNFVSSSSLMSLRSVFSSSTTFLICFSVFYFLFFVLFYATACFLSETSDFIHVLLLYLLETSARLDASGRGHRVVGWDVRSCRSGLRKRLSRRRTVLVGRCGRGRVLTVPKGTYCLFLNTKDIAKGPCIAP